MNLDFWKTTTLRLSSYLLGELSCDVIHTKEAMSQSTVYCGGRLQINVLYLEPGKGAYFNDSHDICYLAENPISCHISKFHFTHFWKKNEKKKHLVFFHLN